MKKPYTLTIFVENNPGVLHRLTVLFTRRRINIDSVTCSATEDPRISRFTIFVGLEERLVPTIVRQICRIIEVQQAYASEDEDLLYREIGFFKICMASEELRAEIEALAKQYAATVAHVETSHIFLEKTGSEEELTEFYKVFEPYGVQEFVRSGRIAIRRRPLSSEIGIPLQHLQIEPGTAGDMV